jgi:hypothetical protein
MIHPTQLVDLALIQQQETLRRADQARLAREARRQSSSDSRPTRTDFIRQVGRRCLQFS